MKTFILSVAAAAAAAAESVRGDCVDVHIEIGPILMHTHFFLLYFKFQIKSQIQIQKS